MPQLIRKRMNTPFTDEDMDRLLEFRGRYVEFNLLYDRGTLSASRQAATWTRS